MMPQGAFIPVPYKCLTAEIAAPPENFVVILVGYVKPGDKVWDNDNAVWADPGSGAFVGHPTKDLYAVARPHVEVLKEVTELETTFAKIKPRGTYRLYCPACAQEFSGNFEQMTGKKSLLREHLSAVHRIHSCNGEESEIK